MPHSTGQATGMKWIDFKISTISPDYKRKMLIVEILENAEKQRIKIAHNPVINLLTYLTYVQ